MIKYAIVSQPHAGPRVEKDPEGRWVEAAEVSDLLEAFERQISYMEKYNTPVETLKKLIQEAK